MGFSWETTFREMVKTSPSEDGGLVWLGGSFAPAVVTEYAGVSSSRRACALVPSSQLWYGVRLGIFPSNRSVSTSSVHLGRDIA